MASQLSAVAPSSARLLGLDLLRLVSIVLVLGRHMEPAPSNLPWPLNVVFDLWNNHGGIGLDVFFVLSGFLVSGLLFAEFRKHGEISVRRFYIRRAWKIYPAFYLLIGFAYFYCLLFLGYKLRDRPVFSELLFLQSYQQGYWNHTWTLAVEEHFYLLLPLVLLSLVRWNRGAADPFRAVPYLVAATSVVCLAARFVNLQLRAEYAHHTHAFPTHLRIDSLFFGVAIAYAYQFHATWFQTAFWRWRFGLIIAGSALLSLTSILSSKASPYYLTLGFAQLYVGAAALMVGVLLCNIPKNWLTISFATLGTFSYSIYLWHMALMYWAIPQLKELGISWQVRTAIYMMGAFVIGIAMAKLLELPALRIRDRMFPSRSASLAESPSVPADGEPSRRAA